MGHKYIKQDGLKDCGVCCLYNIIKYYGGSIDIDKLRIYTKTNSNGTNIYNMVLTSNKLGLNAEAYKCELNDLCSLKLPIIAHIKIDNSCYHFIIIDRIVNNELFIFDPIRGILKYSMEDFANEWTNIVITFNPTNNIIREKEINKFSYIFILIKKYRRIILFFIISSFIVTLLTSINSLFFSELYKNINSSFNIFLSFIILLFIKIILDYYRNIKLVKFNKMLDKEITTTSFKKILFLPYKFHHNRPVGDIVSKLNDLSSIKDFIYKISFTFIVDIFFLLIILILIFKINKILFILTFAITIIYLFFHIYFRKYILSYTIFLKESEANVNSLLIESIVGIDSIKNLSIETQINEKFKNEYDSLLTINSKLNLKYIHINLIKDFIVSFGMILLIFIGINLVNSKYISISNLIAFNSIIIYYFISLENAISIDMSLINAKEAYKRVCSLLKNKREINIKKIGLEFREKIEFKNIIFSYNGINNILKNIDFTIKKGNYIFINGKSGTGKSTLFKLLNKDLEINDNMIFIDNIDINKISKDDIKSNICYVSQNEFIFTGSILDNIKMFKNVSNDELTKAIRISKVDDILKFRNIDLNYILEENGNNLSGGERQKILLARSLLTKRKILILDETMNEIDVSSEREIIKNIKTEYTLTLILISHRTDNSNLFDEIINFNKKGSYICKN